MTEIKTPATNTGVRDSPNGENTTTTRFRPISNPATGERIQFIADDENLIRMNWSSSPGGVIPEHIHPHQQERFEITAGEAHFILNGEEHVVGPGGTIVVPAGARHSEANRGSVAVEGVVELRPALHAREFHETFAGLAADGRTTARGAPRNPLQLGATLWYFRHDSRVTSPPAWAQNVILPPLAALASLFRVRPYYSRWDSRISQPS
jgi:quercetin dioxygenase-like cupin family protein